MTYRPSCMPVAHSEAPAAPHEYNEPFSVTCSLYSYARRSSLRNLKLPVNLLISLHILMDIEVTGGALTIGFPLHSLPHSRNSFGKYVSLLRHIRRRSLKVSV